MSQCPICRTDATQKREVYWQCPNCSCWFQSPPPPKTFIAEFEGPPAVMSDADRKVNIELAASLFRNVMGGKPGKTLDIGCKMPVLAGALQDLGCTAHACDAAPEIDDAHLIDVQFHHTDIENDDDWKYLAAYGPFRLITLIHTFEHIHDPVRLMGRLRQIVTPDGAVFIRMPDHKVSGYERDLTDGHYSIHPFYHCLASVLQCCAETNAFVITDSYAMNGSGQRDIILGPL